MGKKSKKSKSAELWDTQAQLWSQAVRSGKDVFRDLFNNPEFLKFIDDIKGKKVLDAGCGEGYNTRIFAQQGAHVVGIDLSEKMIHLAQEEEQKNPLGIDYHVASFTDLSSLKDESFDIVISFMALMDASDYKEALKEFYRILKTNGKLFFNITHPCFFTPGYKRLEDDNGIIVRNYFRQGPWEFSFALTNKEDASDALRVTSISFHRTLSTYINTLIDVGFVLKKICEPKPSTQAIEQFPRLKKASDVAALLYVHAIKPSGKER